MEFTSQPLESYDLLGPTECYESKTCLSWTLEKPGKLLLQDEVSKVLASRSQLQIFCLLVSVS